MSEDAVVIVKPLKQPIPYAEQIERLKTKHGLIIDDEIAAIGVLKRVNYYRLSAYGISLREPGNKDLYLHGTRFDQIYSLYRFDFRLRHLLLVLLESFEIELRSRMSFYLAMTYDSEGFKDAANFIKKPDKDGNDIYQSTMAKLAKAIKDGHRKPCVMHHNAEYGGLFPAWASVELFTFGMLSSLLSIMKPKDKKAVAHQFGIQSIDQFTGWVLGFLEIRNRCAHNDRIYNMPLSTQLAIFPADLPYCCSPQNRVFPAILSLKRVTSDKDLWEWFFNELGYLLEVHPEVDLSCIGFPDSWKKVLAPK